MKTRKKPLKWILVVTLAVSLFAMGVSYAYWSDDLVVEAKVNTDTFNPIAAVTGQPISGLAISGDGATLAFSDTVTAEPTQTQPGSVDIALDLSASPTTIRVEFPINLGDYPQASIQSVTLADYPATITFTPLAPQQTIAEGTVEAQSVALNVEREPAVHKRTDGSYFVAMNLTVSSGSFLPIFTENTTHTTEVGENIEVSNSYAASPSLPLTLVFSSEGVESWTSTMNCNFTATATSNFTIVGAPAETADLAMGEAPVGTAAETPAPAPEATPATEPAPAPAPETTSASEPIPTE